ncbi:hypothetical protein ILYODFUR_008004 [Ilyodon furcidens]|uniref:Uncharacterized protein n=1 Tax=Ilyodon furcidens TaxID=33524 RepID=A0ABV0TWM5_9TELE
MGQFYSIRFSTISLWVGSSIARPPHSLRKQVYPSSNGLFQQDTAPCQSLRYNGVHSPDPSSVEDLEHF